MNTYCYRLVFNTVRGVLMAVAETVISQGKAPGATGAKAGEPVPPTISRPSRVPLRHRLWILPALLLSGVLTGVPNAWSADAPLTPAGSAGQRPIIDAAANGVPIVNIAPPSRAGVSRNQYQDFNVNPGGLILNNGSGNSNTQLGGWIAGNPQLGPISARIIVNEVVGPNASQLRGALEVAGKKADIVIANPNGLFCDGCGALNAHRLTLTTGQPRYDTSGNLTALDVRQGLITVGQGGLTATDLGQLDLLARGLVLDGEVWAQNLNAIVGANQVLYGTLQQTSQAGAGETPRFAVDIHDLGGLYANQVYLMATDKGLGVNSTGRIAAMAGNFTLSADGDLTLKDSYASQHMALASNGNTSLSGQTQAGGMLGVNAAVAFANSGSIDAHSGVAVSAASINNAGSMTNHASGTLQLASAGNLTNSGTLQANDAITVQASGSVTNSAGQMLAGQRLVVSGAQLGNHHGTLASNGSVTLNGTGLDNRAGTVSGAQVAVYVGNLDNSQGQVIGSSQLTINAGNITNVAGTLASGSGLTLNTADAALDNTGGQIVAQHSLSLANTALVNLGGTIAAIAGDLSLNTRGGQLDNDAGRLQAGGNVALHAGASTSKAGLISGNDVALQLSTLDNSDGQVIASGTLAARTGALTNDGGLFVANGNITLQATRISNNHGRIDTLGQLGVATTGALNNQSGVLAANGDATLAVQTLNNHDGQIGAQGLVLSAATVDNRNGNIVANTDAALTSSSIDNTFGQLGAQGDLLVAALALSNEQGNIGANGNVTVSTQADHLNGTIASQHDVTLNVDGDYTNAGTLTANHNLTLNTRKLSNSGTLTAGGVLTADVAELDNSGTFNADTVRLHASGTLNNHDTGLIDGYDTRIDAGAIANTGRIYGDWLALGADASGGVVGPAIIDNSGPGVIAARQDLQIGAVALTNAEGASIYSLGDIHIAGALDEDGFATGSMQSLNNTSATIEGQGSVRIASAQITQRDSHLTTHDEIQSTEDVVLIYPFDAGGIGYTAERFARIDTGSGHSQFIVHPDVYGQRQTMAPVYPTPGQDGSQGTPQDAWDSPRFAQFGLTPLPPPPAAPGDVSCATQPNAPACARYNADNAAWQLQYSAALNALVPLVAAYNQQVTEDNRVSEFEDYTAVTYTQVRSKTVSDGNAQPAQILSGQDLTLSGSVNNYDSQIVAGGALNIDGPTVSNIGRAGTDTTHYLNGQQYTHTVESCGTFGGSHCGHTTTPVAYEKAAEIIRIVVPTTVYIDHQNQTAPRAIDPATGKPIAADAGSAVTANGNSRHAVDIIPVDGPPSVTVPNSKLFPLHPEPSARYLVETDPAFTQQRNFLSSDYLLNALNISPAYAMKRYGDGFFEQQQVNDQILALTGRRFVAGYQDTEAEYQALMQAGVVYAKQFQLTPGVALTAAQMASLTTDMVWLEQTTVTLPDGSRQDVLVPRVYLKHANTGDLQTGGALIAGADVFVTTSGQLSNSGNIQGGNVSLAAGTDLVNQNGSISGQNIYARASNDLKNLSGVILGSTPASVITLSAGRDIVLQTQTVHSINAASTRDTIGHVATVQGGDVRLDAGRDLNAQGASVNATSGDLIATAGRNITLSTAEGRYQMDSVDGATQGRANALHESSLTHQGSSFTAAGNVALLGQGDVALTGATLRAGEQVLLQGQNVTVAATKDRQATALQGIGKHEYSSVAHDDESATGGSITGAGNVTLRANGDASTGKGNIGLTGAYISSDNGQASLIASNNISVDALQTHHSASTESYYSGGTALTKTTKADATQTTYTQSVGSAVTGSTVLIQAGDKFTGRGDITISGSQVVSDRGLQISAGHDLTITTSEDASQSSSSHEQKTSGLYSSGGASITLGKRTVDQDQQSRTLTQTGSSVGSLTGDVDLSAGNAYVQSGSTVSALQGDVGITARTVDITAATNVSQSSQQDRMQQSGLTLAVAAPVIAMVQTAKQMGEAAQQANGDKRLQAMAAATTGLAAYNAAGAVAADPQTGGGVSLSITVGGAKSASTQTQQSTTAVGSSVTAGGSVRINASGGGKDGSHLNVIGSDISAGRDVLLKSEGDVNLQAAQNTFGQHSENSSASAGVGLAISYGSNGAALGVTANAAAGRGNADGNDTSWSNSHINAGKTLVIESGGDTLIKGATVSANQVLAEVGGNLNIESLQDTSSYDSRQQNAGGSVTVGYGFSGSASASQQKMNSDYASVGEQSGIKAGDGGFTVNVRGNTDLHGGVIASNQVAIDAGLNHFSTATLTQSDIENHAQYSASSIGLGGGYSLGGGGMMPLGQGGDTGAGGVGTTQSGEAASAGGKVPGSNLPTTGPNGQGMSASTPAVMAASGDGSSTTQSGISAGVINITDSAGQQALTGQTIAEAVAALDTAVSTDNDSTGALQPVFNQQEIEAGFAVTKQLAAETGTFLDNKAREAQTKADHAKDPNSKGANGQPLTIVERAELFQESSDLQADWGPGGLYRQVIGALTAAASGNVTGSTAAMVQNGTINYLQSLATSQVKALADSLNDEGARVALQGLVGCAGAAASGQSCSPAALGAASSVVLNTLLDAANNVDVAQLTPLQREERIKEIQSVIAGIALATGADGNAATAASAARTESENNAVSLLPTNPFGIFGLALEIQQQSNKKPTLEEEVLGKKAAAFPDLGMQTPSIMASAYELLKTGQFGKAAILSALGVQFATNPIGMNLISGWLDGLLPPSLPAPAQNNTPGGQPIVVADSGKGVLVNPGQEGQGATVHTTPVADQTGNGIIATPNDGSQNGLGIVISTSNSNRDGIPVGKVDFDQLAKPDANELRAGVALSNAGFDVTHQETANDRGVRQKQTADLNVSSLGQIDVLTPESLKLDSVLGSIEKKNGQANGILIHIDLPLEEMQQIANRTWGKPTARNINVLLFQDKNGNITIIKRN